MIHGSLADKIVKFALPLMATSVLQQLFNAADIAVVGRFASPQAMAAVGSNASVINLILGLFIGLSVGANVVIANLIGAGYRGKRQAVREEKRNKPEASALGTQSRINEAVHTVIAVALCAGVITLTAGLLAARPILKMMGAPEDVMGYAILYLRIYCLAMPFIMLYNFGSAILRSKGDSRRPLLSLLLSGIINVVLNLILVVFFHLHVIGVAVATVVSNIIGAALVMYFLMTEEDDFRFSFKRLRISRPYLVGMTRVGIPAGVQGMVFSLSNVVIQTTINSFGANAIAGSTAAQNLEFMSYCVVNAFGQTTVTFTSQNYGAGDTERCKRVFRLSMLIGMGIDLVVLALFLLFRDPIMSLFTTDEAVLGYAFIRIMRVCGTHFLIGTYEISGGALRGMNHSLLPALISIFGTCAFRLLWVFAVVGKHHTFETLMLVYPASWILTGTLMLTSYFVARKRLFKELENRKKRSTEPADN